MLATLPLVIAALGSDPVIGHVAVADEGQVIAYQIRASGLTATSTTRVEDVRSIAWGSPSAPIVVMSVEEIGVIDDGDYREVKRRGKGDLLWLEVDRKGAVWAARCLRWADECARLRWYEVTPGKRSRKTAPKPPAIAAAAAPDSVELTPSKARVGPDTFHGLACEDPSGPVTLFQTSDEIIAAPTWRWLATEPPIALVSVYPAPVPEPFTYLLRGCTLAEARVDLGPRGLWALGTDDGYVVYQEGRELGTVRGYRLAFSTRR